MQRNTRLAWNGFYRKELRKVAGLAYERELATALELLEENFRQWKGNKITVFELSDFIHQFHNGISRDLWGFYERGNSEMIADRAIINGIISKSEISLGILEKLGIIVLKMPQM